MRNWSVVAKIAVSICIIATILLTAAGILVITFEQHFVRAFVTAYTVKQQIALQERQQAASRALRDEIQLDTVILSGISASHVYDVDAEAMQHSLQSFMAYPSILAIQVLDEDQKPFAAAWRAPDVQFGKAIPEGVTLDKQLMIAQEISRDKQVLGSVAVYYSDVAIREAGEQAKRQTAVEAEEFQQIAHESLSRVMMQQIIGIVLILFILALALLFLLRKFVLKPLTVVNTMTQQLSNFNLAITLPSLARDEFGMMVAAINRVIQQFRSIIGQVQHSGIQVTSSATELSATAKQQEATLRTQVEAIHEVSKSTQDIAELATHLVDTMREVAVMSGETAEFASSGQTDLTRMQEAMQNMEAASKSISGRLSTINEKAENITNVVTTITKVADQTNLLSLNAAIEAEKAGEYGRGFTVVAREIRRLADQTAVATLDIDQMVHEMQSAVSAGVMEMDKFIADVRHSAEDVEKISEQLARIIEQVQTVSPRFEEVNVAMEDQSQHAREINQTMTNLSVEMQETRDSLHETYSAIEQLNEAARTLGEQVSQFRVT